MSNSLPPSTLTINRTLVGAISLLLLTIAGSVWLVTGGQDVWTGACLKVGLVIAAFWLALPTISRNGDWGQASWTGVCGFVALALVLTARRVDNRIVVPLLTGVFLTTMVLRPRSRPK